MITEFLIVNWIGSSNCTKLNVFVGCAGLSYRIQVAATVAPHQSNLPTLNIRITVAFPFNAHFTSIMTIDEVKEKRPLKVIVVGAGIGGIACAVECHRRGYQVSMYDAVKVKSLLLHL